jgi:hypothetical protein
MYFEEKMYREVEKVEEGSYRRRRKTAELHGVTRSLLLPIRFSSVKLCALRGEFSFFSNRSYPVV